MRDEEMYKFCLSVSASTVGLLKGPHIKAKGCLLKVPPLELVDGIPWSSLSSATKSEQSPQPRGQGEVAHFFL